MKWFIPSFNGDLRLEPNRDDPAKTDLTIHKPTPAEKEVLSRMIAVFDKEGWTDPSSSKALQKPSFLRSKRVVTLNVPLAKIGPEVAKLFRPGDAVLTAIMLKDGLVITCSGTKAELVEVVRAAEAEGEKKPEKKPEAAATVKRPTPCCPDCFVGAVEPASEVLQAFLSPEQHETWAQDRAIVVHGSVTGHRYVLAHRKTPLAARIGRICYDLDDEMTLHFHQTEVPPEEEVLAAKLILENREPWLRNEATAFDSSRRPVRQMVRGRLIDTPSQPIRKFKNPFGDGLDGTADASLTSEIGTNVLRFFGATRH